MLPALVDALEEEIGPEFAVHGLHALSKLRGIALPEGRDFSLFALGFAKSGNLSLAEKSLLALGIRGDARAAGPLTAILLDTETGRYLLGRTQVPERLRAFAAYALGLVAARNAEPALRSNIDQSLVRAMEAAEQIDLSAACVIARGLAPLPIENEFADDSGAAPTASRIEQVLHMLAAFEDDRHSAPVRAQMPRSLARLLDGAPDSLRVRVAHALLDAIGPHTQEPREVQAGAVLALGAIGNCGTEPIDQEIRVELERVAYRSSADQHARYLAMVALGEVGSRASSTGEPYAALASVRKVLLRNLTRSRGETLSWTSLALGILEEKDSLRSESFPPESGAALRAALAENRSTEVTGAIAIALGLLHDPEAEPLLSDLLRESGEEHERGYAALALGMLGSRTALPLLRSVMDGAGGQPFALEQTAISLALLGDQETSERLVTILQSEGNPEVQTSIASALGWIRDPRPLPRLLERMQDASLSDHARAWTAVAIGRICDKDPWPWVGRLSVGVLYETPLTSLVDLEFQNGLLDLP